MDIDYYMQIIRSHYGLQMPLFTDQSVPSERFSCCLIITFEVNFSMQCRKEMLPGVSNLVPKC